MYSSFQEACSLFHLAMHLSYCSLNQACTLCGFKHDLCCISFSLMSIFYLSKDGFSPASKASCSSLTSVAWPGCLKSPTSVSPCSRIKSTHCSTTRGAMWSPYLLSYRTVSSNLWPNTPAMAKYKYRAVSDRPHLACYLTDMCWNSARTHY